MVQILLQPSIELADTTGQSHRKVAIDLRGIRTLYPNRQATPLFFFSIERLCKYKTTNSPLGTRCQWAATPCLP